MGRDLRGGVVSFQYSQGEPAALAAVEKEVDRSSGVDPAGALSNTGVAASGVCLSSAAGTSAAGAGSGHFGVSETGIGSVRHSAAREPGGASGTFFRNSKRVLRARLYSLD